MVIDSRSWKYFKFMSINISNVIAFEGEDDFDLSFQESHQAASLHFLWRKKVQDWSIPDRQYVWKALITFSSRHMPFDTCYLLFWHPSCQCYRFSSLEMLLGDISGTKASLFYLQLSFVLSFFFLDLNAFRDWLVFSLYFLWE